MAGKTFLLIDLAFHIALGLEWYGHAVKKAPVLFVVFEDAEGFRLRCLAAARKLGLPDNVARMLQVITLNKTDDGTKGAKAIIAAAKELEAKCGQPVGLIGIDTRIKAVAGDDENSNSDAAIYQAQRLAPIVAGTGAAVISVAHPNKEGGLRGASYIRQGDECVLYADGRALHAEKVKNGTTGPLFEYRLEPMILGLDGAGDPVTSCTVDK